MTPGANVAFAELLEEDADEDATVNIVVADFIEMEDLISSIIDRNYRLGLKLPTVGYVTRTNLLIQTRKSTLTRTLTRACALKERERERGGGGRGRKKERNQ